MNDMNETIRVFLEILAAAVHGRRAEIPREIPTNEWQTLFHIAGIHNVLPLFYEAVYGHPSLADANLRQAVRQQVILQALRTGEFLELNDRLLSAGVEPLVVKGIVCRNLYPQPDHRPSSDEDVLIPAGQFELCHGVLTEFGMATEAEWDSYEVPYRKAGSPLYIELHKSLFPPESDAYGDMNRFFENAGERAVALQIQGRTVYTMCPTDHLFYLLCHAFKHFLHSGFGLRQVCDIALFARAYEARIHWPRLLELCRAVRADRFTAAVFRIGQNHLFLGTVPGVFQDIPGEEEPMLLDLLNAGIYGGATMSRRHSSNITLDAVTGEKGGRARSLRASLFPPAEKLEGRYPYLKEKPWLLPAAWVSRIGSYLRESSGDNSAADALKIGNDRVELLRFYHILP